MRVKFGALEAGEWNPDDYVLKQRRKYKLLNKVPGVISVNKLIAYDVR